VVNGVMYVLSTGCQWRYIPKDLESVRRLHEGLQSFLSIRRIEARRRKASAL
jgi:transposase